MRAPDRLTLQRNGPSPYNKNFDFNYQYTNSQFTVTSVSGHLMEHDFGEAHRKWHSCDPFELFDAPIETRVKKASLQLYNSHYYNTKTVPYSSQESKGIERNLQAEARTAQKLMIWTDCDREGENIGDEVKKVCKKVNRNMQVVRARFSAIINA